MARAGARRWPWLLIGVHVLGLAPLAALVWAYVRGDLGVDLVGELSRRTGRYALTFLLLSLVPTAVQRLTGEGRLRRLRRPLGLYAFGYANLHLLIYAGLDYGFALGMLAGAIGQDRFILLGLAAFAILLALALTSTDAAVRRLGRNWRRLHRLTYLAAVLVVLHYLLSFKELRATPLLLGLALLLLLAARLVRRRPSTNP